MPSSMPESSSASYLSRRSYSAFVMLVLALFGSCMLAMLIPLAFLRAVQNVAYVNEFPMNLFMQFLFIPPLLLGASVGALATQLIRWRFGAASDLWYRGVAPLLKGWAIAGVVLPILMLLLQSGAANPPWVGSVMLFLTGGFAGSLIGRQQQPVLRAPLSQELWVAATMVAWASACACTSLIIRTFFAQL